ncbi:MAG: helix-turn-helix transcriptional regulator [Pseudomonadota bacterium]
MDIGKLLKKERILKGLSQQDLASRVKISKQALQRIEVGATKKSKYLPDICLELGIDFVHIASSGNQADNTKNNNNSDKMVAILLQRVDVLERRLSQIESVCYLK